MTFSIKGEGEGASAIRFGIYIMYIVDEPIMRGLKTDLFDWDQV